MSAFGFPKAVFNWLTSMSWAWAAAAGAGPGFGAAIGLPCASKRASLAALYSVFAVSQFRDLLLCLQFDRDISVKL